MKNKIKNSNLGFTHLSTGFTLVEIVSVIGLFLIITLVIYNIFLISKTSFDSGDENLEITQNSRIFLDRITREIRQTPDIVTNLPETKEIIGFSPAEEILFQNGHDAVDIRYIRYYLDNNLIKRQSIAYYFKQEEEIYVLWNAQDELNQPPESKILEEKTIAEYITLMNFYGSSVTYIEIWSTKNSANNHLYTGVWGRNTRL